jgi:subfamily B ATP-binding cassette protein MsbA
MVDRVDGHAVGDWHLLRQLLRLFTPKANLLALSLLGYLLYSLGVVLLADLLQLLLDGLAGELEASESIIVATHQAIVGGSENVDVSDFRILAPLAIIGLTLIRAVGFFAGNYSMHRVARDFVHEMRVRLFGKILYAPSAYFDRHSPGVLLAKITYNVEQLADGIIQALTHLLREGLVVIALMSYMLYLNWRLTLILAAVMPLIALVVLIVGRLFRSYSTRILDSMGNVAQIGSESFSAIKEIRMHGAQDDVQRRFGELSDYNREQSLKLAFAEALSTPVMQLLLAVAIALLIWFALSPALAAQLSPGGFAAFLVAAVQLGKPVRQLSSVHSILQRGLAAAEDIFQQLAEASEPDEGARVLERAEGEIEFRGLSFTYPNTDQPALLDVSFRVRAGETVAIVGPSGSGKSTLVQLLCRFYSAPPGTILIDTLPIETLTLESLRHQMAMVGQRPMLFRDTVANNVGFGARVRQSKEDVTNVLQLADAMEFVQRLPLGLNTVLGSDGESLSGGQRQRLALARAILKDAPILLLDEGTSALDNDSERRVQKALQTYLKGRTALVIAHRLSSVIDADRIIVLNEGKIVAQGSHEDLLAQPGLYAQLYKDSHGGSA